MKGHLLAALLAFGLCANAQSGEASKGDNGARGIIADLNRVVDRGGNLQPALPD